MNIWEDIKLRFRCYSTDSHKIIRPVSNSKLFKKYPTLPTNIDYGTIYWYDYQQKEIIDILEKLQILNPKYQDKYFNNITQKCIQIIIYTKNLLCNDLIYLIIKLLLDLMPHNKDFIYHNQQLKIEQNNST